MSPKRTDARLRSSLLVLLLGPASVLAACGDDVTNRYYNYYGDGGADAGADPVGHGGKGVGGSTAGKGPKPAAGSPGEGGTGGDESVVGGAGGSPEFPVDPLYPDAPQADTQVADQDLKIFDQVGNRYWFAVTDEQRQQMNQKRWGGGGGPIPGGGNGDIYQPGGSGDGNANWVDHLWITTAGDNPQTADYGRVQVRVVGQTTGRDWVPEAIPSLNIDADQFVKNQRLGGYEHLRFANGLVGNIFRERVTLELYKMMDYPAPLTTYAWVSSNVWGSDVSIPYTLVERYKQKFCERYKTDFGGGCANMWEFVGDFNRYYGGGGPKGGDMGAGGGIVGPGPGPGPGPGNQPSLFDDPENCQIDKCDNARVKDFEYTVSQTPRGEGFAAALADYVDWPAFHKFQCLSWILGTGDDALHNTNNVVLVERSDGLFQYLPYSVDISLGMDWYPYVSLPAPNQSIAGGCQSDDDCWADTISTCESMLEQFTDLKPNEFLKSIYDQLDGEGMLRSGDEERYQMMDAWFTSRLAAMPDELETFRDPNAVFCQWPEVDCGGYCTYYEYCQPQCIPPGKDPGPMPGAGGAPGVDEGGVAGAGIVAGSFNMGGGVGVGGGVGAGGDGGIPECPVIDNYEIAR